MRVLFFASVRERLGCHELHVPNPGGAMTTDSLLDVLMIRGGESWRDVLTQPNLICAVNQSVVHDATRLSDDDEIAFFPPVTGG